MPEIRVAQVIGKWLGGGVEAVVMNYYRNIDRNKIQFDFICDSDSTNIPKDEIENLGGRVILVPPYQDVANYQRELKKIFKENNYKIVHSHVNTLSIFSLRAAKKAGVPIRIAHSHSTTNKKEWKKNLLKQALRPFSKVYATDYFACSEYAGKWLFGEKIFSQGRVKVIKNAIDLEEFKYDERKRKRIRKELGISDDTMVIGHIGRLVAQKNQDFLIDIFKAVHVKNPKTTLIMIGQGPDKAKIEKKVKELGLGKSVKFLGQRNDTHELYSAFDVFVLPSLYEGLPVVGVEAQASGIPCVFSSEISSEVKILPTAIFLDLGSDALQWADTIFSQVGKGRYTDALKEMIEKGYSLEHEAVELEWVYNRILRRLNDMRN